MEQSTAQHISHSFATMDQLLGDGKTRFFGDGFRQVQDFSSDLHIDTRARQASAVSRLVYPQKWSSKKTGDLQAHLSTLDGLTLASQLVESYLRVAYGLSEEQAGKMFLSRVVLKSGATPTLDLASIAVDARLLETNAAPDASGDRVSAFSIQVGTMAVELSVQHAGGEHRQVEARHGDVSELIGASERNYYGGAFRRDAIAVRDLEFSRGNESVNALLDLDGRYVAGPLLGMSSAYAPFVSPIHVIICAAQMSQVLMYRYDGVTRETSHNLWMRKVVMHAQRPARAGRALAAEVRVAKMSLLSLKDAAWRVASFTATLPGIVVEHNLAHQLPDGVLEARG